MRVAEAPAPTSRVLRRGGPLYPALLEATPDPPGQLHVRGDPALLLRPGVAVVGSRRATGLGMTLAEQLGAGLAEAGVVVVSGCARGIDAAAHRGALTVGGATVAVLAGGLDVAAPRATRRLAETIAARGCLVSEHPPGTPVARWSFPRRNRIIAGLARIVVVVEAAKTSGALTTARHAQAAGREVMAVPGQPLLPVAVGVNGLLADGARPVRGVADVLEELGDLPPLARPVSSGAGPESPGGLAGRLLAALTAAPASAEDLAAELGVPVRAVLAALTEIELLGLARTDAGGRFARPGS